MKSGQMGVIRQPPGEVLGEGIGRRRSKMNRCEKCSFRARFDKNPRSLLGRLWKWHIGWCPGWKAYLRSLSDEERKEVSARYG